MELADEVVENKLFNRVLLIHAEVFDFEVAVDHLALLSEDVNAGFIGVNDHSLDLVIAVVSDHRLLDSHLDDSSISDPSEGDSLVLFVIAFEKEEIVFHSEDVTLRERQTGFDLSTDGAFVNFGLEFSSVLKDDHLTSFSTDEEKGSLLVPRVAHEVL